MGLVRVRVRGCWGEGFRCLLLGLVIEAIEGWRAGVVGINPCHSISIPMTARLRDRTVQRETAHPHSVIAIITVSHLDSHISTHQARKQAS